jgi:hypothetical protein
MTDLRFGTDTGQVARDERERFASVELEISQRVTSAGLLRVLRLRDPPLHAVKGSPAIAEGHRRSDEVTNSMGVGTTFRSGTQVQPD